MTDVWKTAGILRIVCSAVKVYIIMEVYILKRRGCNRRLLVIYLSFIKLINTHIHKIISRETTSA